jgi:hypothetical protein
MYQTKALSEFHLKALLFTAAPVDVFGVGRTGIEQQ